MGRFTHTCMGNTFLVVKRGVDPAVHPHMHGEYLVRNQQSQGQLGSPPHAWGIPVLTHAKALLSRFTPTCMGNTLDQ